MAPKPKKAATTARKGKARGKRATTKRTITKKAAPRRSVRTSRKKATAVKAAANPPPAAPVSPPTPSPGPSSGDKKPDPANPPSSSDKKPKVRRSGLLDLLFSSSPPAAAQEGGFKPHVRDPTHAWDDLAGIDEIKATILQNVVLPFSYPVKASMLNIETPSGLLLVGPPGTGKTVLADAIVTEIRRRGRNVKYFLESGACLHKYLGETERQLRILFQKAEKEAPCVIFLDELDGLARKRSSSSHGDCMASIQTTLLTLVSEVKRGSVLLIAATNCPEMVDPALIRTGRFDERVQMPLPNHAGRSEILSHYLRKKNHVLDAKDLARAAEATANFSGSDLEALCRTIHRNIIKRIFPGGSWRLMSEAELKIRAKELDLVNFEEDILPELRKINGKSGEAQSTMYS